MRIGPYARVLLVLVVVLVAISVFATEQAFYYRSLYYDNPRIKIEQSKSIIYGKWDPNRSSSYTCTVQEVVDSVGMVCESPDGNRSINCTVGEGETGPRQYFC
jgi:hypothetical protein